MTDASKWKNDRNVSMKVKKQGPEAICVTWGHVTIYVTWGHVRWDRTVAQRVETTLALLVLVIIWFAARSTTEPLPSCSRECFVESLDTQCLDDGFQNGRVLGRIRMIVSGPLLLSHRYVVVLNLGSANSSVNRFFQTISLVFNPAADLCHAVIWSRFMPRSNLEPIYAAQ